MACGRRRQRQRQVQSISCLQNKKSGANAQLRSAAALVADTACGTTRWYPKGTRRGLKTSSTGPMLSRFRTMLFSLGQSSNSDVDVGFPRPQQVSVRHWNRPPRGCQILAVARVWRTFTVRNVLWLESGVQLRLTSDKVLVKV